ncbi:class I SAM-dependent methyltransferase, partial [Saprospiraceae bacterium]|nr:class I SAM-dependent methyltransferase [Saprospiraceae bacterium]
EINSTMRKKAKKRLQFCGIIDTQIYNVPINSPYPFPDASFDIILLESVLAIQTLNGLHWMLDEFDRLLKSGGQLAFNETIWLPNQDPLKIKAFNESCLNHFGIIQSNDELIDVNAWKNLLFTKGWKIEYCKKVEEWQGKMTYGWRNHLSLLFSIIGGFKAKFQSQQIQDTKAIKKLEDEIYAKNKCKMNAYIFISKKVK